MPAIAIADDMRGEVQPVAAVVEELERRFPGEVVRLASAFPRWPMEAWSNTFVLDRREGKPWFLKGTPRLRREAEVVEELAALAPEHVPRLLVSDLLTDSPWRWFIMEHAGDPVIGEDLEFQEESAALEMVRTLARVQRKAAQSERLRELLPRCEPGRLREVALEACAWYAHNDREHGAEYEEMTQIIARDDVFFSRLADALSPFPCTVVHGDFRGGNAARDGATIRLLDWAEAVWSAGGISLASLTGQHEESLSAKAAAIWEAYGAEFGQSFPASAIAACGDADTVTGILWHQQISACCEVGPHLREAARRTFAQLAEAVTGAGPPREQKVER